MNFIERIEIVPKDTFFNLSEEKQENVIRAAVSEFLKYGFEKGNIGNIAKSAGVAKGSMYQYYENKKELFIYSVHWTSNYFFKKFNNYSILSGTDIFDYIFESSRQILQQIREEKELAIFIQDVFLGRYINMTDESINVMLKASDEYVLKLIQEGKKNGSIRKDMDDRILCLFLTGATLKIKENILNKARNSGMNITDKGIDMYESDIKAMLELLKNGMGQTH
jgi:AcrR family transcriptional regulator